MKIIFRPRDFARGNTTTPTPHTDLSHISNPWPAQFARFLDWTGTPLELSSILNRDKSQHLYHPHGKAGCEAIWTREIPLDESWRVAAHHSNKVASIEHFDPLDLQQADGITTRGRHFIRPLAIYTADCMAIATTLETEDRVELASCFHAGWRGYVTGIQQVALKAYFAEQTRLLKASPDLSAEIYITVSPAIVGQNYPCGADVLQAIQDHHAKSLMTLKRWTKHHEDAFWASVGVDRFERDAKIYPDLQALFCIEAHALGIQLQNLAVFRDDTFSSDWWPSHRRAMAQGQPRSGRLITHLSPSACS